MNRVKVLIAIGGTGGHVFPGCNLAEHLIENNYKVSLVADKRGYKFLNNFKNLDVTVIPSTPILKNNIISQFSSLSIVFYSIVRSLFFLIFNRPVIVFGMGGYAAFPICIAAKILRIRFVIYENNLLIGKANRFLLPFSEKILVSNKELEGIEDKYKDKIIEIGNIIKKEIINFSKDYKGNSEVLKILVLGGSQAAEVFADTLPEIFKKCLREGIKLRVYQHCLPSQNRKLELFYRETKINFETFNFSSNLTDYFSKVDIAITRSGSSILAELVNANIPFISVPLPSSADNHQLKNANYYKRKNLAFLVEEKDLNKKLLNLIKDIFQNSSNFEQIKKNQRQYSDKNVYENIDIILKKIIDEKN